ncbi:MAG: 50S ribosomal protein L6 [Candidatus Aenigmatarchaeota archaeon]
MEREFQIPEGVNVEVEGKTVKVSGKNGQLTRTFKYFYDIKITKENGKVKVSCGDEKRKAKAMVGTIIAHLKNMSKGVSKGYKYKMKIVYSHFPMSVKVDGDKVLINNFIGEKSPRIAKIVGKTKVEVIGQDIILSGIDKEEVGQTMGNIEQACRITKFDRRIFQDGIYFVGEEDG